ncbi:MAG: hypothetical protein ACRDNW_17690 [Trebonia sp.]
MNGNLMYEVVRQRMAEQQWAAQAAGEAYARREAVRELRAAARERRAAARERRAAARERRAVARRRRAGAGAPDSIDMPAIPDFAHEMFEPTRDAVPVPDTRGRPARPGR